MPVVISGNNIKIGMVVERDYRWEKCHYYRANHRQTRGRDQTNDEALPIEGKRESDVSPFPKFFQNAVSL